MQPELVGARVCDDDVPVPIDDDRPASAARRWTAIGAVAVLTLTGIALVPSWLVSLDVRGLPVTGQERLGAVNDTRATLLQVVGGVVLAFGIIATWRRLRINEEELRASRDGQITERFSRAIDHIGSASVDVRMGGIYALERVARNSPADRDAIMALLCAFVRGHSPWPPDQSRQLPADTPLDEIPTLAVRSNDVQAAVTTLGRLQTLRGAERIGIPRVDLRYARMDTLTLDNANLGYANLSRARMRGTSLRGAYLRGADLRQAELQSADLREADLREASLEGARANTDTRWPDQFDPLAAGIVTQ
jgi:Pentapeptide repeats (8 copies)